MRTAMWCPAPGQRQFRLGAAYHPLPNQNPDRAALRRDRTDAAQGVLASGQIQMRKVDGWETLSQPLEPIPLDIAA